MGGERPGERVVEKDPVAAALRIDAAPRVPALRPPPLPLPTRGRGTRALSVMVALVATIHVFARARPRRRKAWMVGTSPTMTGEARTARGTLSCKERAG